VRYRGAAGGAEKAHSRHQRRWCLWSKPVNLGTWGLVPDPIAMAHAFVELGYGTVVHTRENGFKCGHIFALRPFRILELEINQIIGQIRPIDPLNLISNSTPKTHTQNSLQLQFKLNDTTTIKGMQTLRRTSTPTRTHHQPPPLSEQQAHRKRPTYVYLDKTAWTERSGATRQHTHLLVLVEEGDHVGTVGGLLKAHEGHVRTWVPDRCRRLSTCACLGRQRGGHRAGQRLCRRLDMAQYP